MNGLMILTSMGFVAFIIYKITKIRILKYILSPIISILYGFMLFFVGMGVGGILYFILLVAPVVVDIINKIYANKKPH